jgi:hypothetical protein
MHQQQHKQSSSAHHSFFADDLHQPAAWNCHGVDIELSDGSTHHVPGVLPVYRALDRSLALQTHYCPYLITTW